MKFEINVRQRLSVKRVKCTASEWVANRGGGGTSVFFGWVCAALNSKLAPCSKKSFP